MGEGDEGNAEGGLYHILVSMYMLLQPQQDAYLECQANDANLSASASGGPDLPHTPLGRYGIRASS